MRDLAERLSPATDRNLDRAQITLLITILVAVLALCSRSLWNGFARDDFKLIVHNQSLGNWAFLSNWLSPTWWSSRAPRTVFFRPVEHLWFELNFALVGRSAIGWHALKILLHLGVVLLVFRIARLLSGSIGAALLTALLFGLLPAHDDSVAWVTSPEPLAAALELAAFCFVIRSAQDGRPVSVGGLVFFAISVLAFEGTIVFPLLVFLYSMLLDGERSGSIEHGLSSRRLMHATLVCVPYLIIAALYFWFRIAVLKTSELPLLGPDPHRLHHSLSQVLATIPTVVLSHLSIAVLPWANGPAHQVYWVDRFASAAFLRPLAILVLCVSSFLFGVWRSPRRNLYLFAASWFFICLGPMLNLDYVEELVEDRWTYLSSFGWCLLLAEALLCLGQKRGLRVPAAALATAIVVSYGVAMWQAEYYWRSDDIFVARGLEMFPDSPKLLIVHAQQLESRGDWKSAEQDLLKLVRLRPDSRLYHFQLSLAEQHLGNRAAADSERAKSRTVKDGPNSDGR
jgi:hypothetical protein